MRSEPSYRRHIGHISSNWELTGDYGIFFNRCRLEAWKLVQRSYALPTRVIDFGCATGTAMFAELLPITQRV